MSEIVPMTEYAIDHVRHGWALLALRLPEIRAIPAHEVAELCECYSLAILHLEKLRRERASDLAIKEYEEIRYGIEQEVDYDIAQFAKRLGKGLLK
jgi:hypothetical protein